MCSKVETLVNTLRNISECSDEKCLKVPKQGEWWKKVRTTTKVQNVRQLITQIRQEVFQKGVLSAGSIYLYEQLLIRWKGW